MKLFDSPIIDNKYQVMLTIIQHKIMISQCFIQPYVNIRWSEIFTRYF